jgi:hypothetical protein
MTGKLKSLLRSEQTFMAGLVCLIGIISFVLGRYSVVEPFIAPDNQSNEAGIVFTDAPEQAISTTTTVSVVASSGGTKYHLPTCSGAKRIKESNKIYFNSILLAKAAGYEPAVNCKGLE